MNLRSIVTKRITFIHLLLDQLIDCDLFVYNRQIRLHQAKLGIVPSSALLVAQYSVSRFDLFEFLVLPLLVLTTLIQFVGMILVKGQKWENVRNNQIF